MRVNIVQELIVDDSGGEIIGAFIYHGNAVNCWGEQQKLHPERAYSIHESIEIKDFEEYKEALIRRKIPIQKL